MAAGHSSVIAETAGLRLPLQTHPLQALVSELYEQVLDSVVMSNAVHVYVSQAHKGELVLGAGIDGYNSYVQRGSVHVIEHQLAAALELFPVFEHARVEGTATVEEAAHRRRRRSSGTRRRRSAAAVSSRRPRTCSRPGHRHGG